MIAKVARVGWGIDTIAQLTATNCDNLVHDGASFVARYLPSLSESELEAIFATTDLDLVPIAGYARSSGWNSASGHADGMDHVARAHALGVPEGAHLWLDCEGAGGSAQEWIDYVTAWAAVVIAAGYQGGAYEGAGVPLTGAQWYSIGGITGYWQSCSDVPRVAVCGPMILQWHNFNQRRPDGLEVDYDFIGPDKKGRLPVVVSAG